MQESIIKAIEQNSITEIARILEVGFNINLSLDEKGHTALHLAVLLDKPDLVAYLLEAGSDPFLTDQDKLTPSECAMLGNHTAIVALFLEKNALINSRILIAIAENNVGLFQRLVKRCQNDMFVLEDMIQSDYSVLHYLAAMNRDKLVTCLGKEIANIDVLINKKMLFNKVEVTPLGLACIHGHLSMVEWFLSRGADRFVTDKNQESPLFYAARIGAVDVIKLLLKEIDSPLDILKKKNRQKRDMLELALIRSHEAIGIFLINTYPNLLLEQVPILFEESYLHLAARKGLFSLVKLMLEKGVSPNLVTRDSTPIMETLDGDYIEVFQLLQAAGANLHFEDNQGNNVFLLAAEAGAKKILTYCLAQKIFSIETKNKKEETSLMLASGTSDLETIRLLIAQGANVFCRSVFGTNVLHSAAYHANWEVITYFVSQHHVSVFECSKSGDTPLDVCLQGGLKAERLLRTSYTALKLLTLMYHYNLKSAYHHLLLLNAYAKRVIYHISDVLRYPNVEERFNKPVFKLRNISSNQASQAMLTVTMAEKIFQLQRLLFEYYLLFFRQSRLFLLLPREVLIKEILCKLLNEKTDGLIDEEDSYLIDGLLKAIEKKMPMLQKMLAKKHVDTSNDAVEEHSKQWLTLCKPLPHYPRIYQDLLRWIEKLGCEKINAVLPNQCAPLYRHRTPLTAAIESGFEKLVGYCLMWGADPNQVDGMGQYPLHAVCHQGNLTMLDFLLRYDLSASLLKMNARGHYPLHEAIFGKNVVLLERLLVRFYDYPCFYQEEEKRSLNQTHAISLESTNAYGETPLELAYVTDQARMTAALLERHVNFYGYIQKRSSYLNLPLTPLAWEGFKYTPLWHQTLRKRRVSLIESVNHVTHDAEIFSQVHQPMGLEDLYALKFRMVKFCIDMIQTTMYPATELRVLRDYVETFSLRYFLPKERLHQLFKLKRLLINFQNVLNEIEVKEKINGLFNGEETILDSSEEEEDEKKTRTFEQLESEKKSAWRYLMQKISETSLMQEALSIQAIHPRGHLIPLSVNEYEELLTFQLNTASECFLKMQDLWKELLENDEETFFEMVDINRDCASFFGILHDISCAVSSLMNLDAFDIHRFEFDSLNKQDSLKKLAFFHQLLSIQNSLFNSMVVSQSRDDANDEKTEKQKKQDFLTVKEAFKLLGIFSKLKIVPNKSRTSHSLHTFFENPYRFELGENVTRSSSINTEIKFPKP